MCIAQHGKPRYERRGAWRTAVFILRSATKKIDVPGYRGLIRPVYTIFRDIIPLSK
jgi:hypothetical protein